MDNRDRELLADQLNGPDAKSLMRRGLEGPYVPTPAALRAISQARIEEREAAAKVAESAVCRTFGNETDASFDRGWDKAAKSIAASIRGDHLIPAGDEP